ARRDHRRWRRETWRGHLGLHGPEGKIVHRQVRISAQLREPILRRGGLGTLRRRRGGLVFLAEEREVGAPGAMLAAVADAVAHLVLPCALALLHAGDLAQ